MSEGYEWRTNHKNGDAAPITVSITSPTNEAKTGNPAAHYVPINRAFQVTATARDCDSYRLPVGEGGDGEWYGYEDDVTSGGTAADHHMWWVVTSGDGSFPETSKYGQTGIYLAPDYLAGSDLRTVTVQARVDDFQRDGDNLGDPADAQVDSDNFALKVWQVTVTASQAGTKSGNNDADTAPVTFGGANLGWVVPGNPAGAAGYHGNTEIKGSIPAGPGVVTGYQWRNDMKGEKNHAINGVWQNPKTYDQANWELDFDDTYVYLDADSRHPNGTGNDVREIFAVDAPGTQVGASNNAGIGNGWTDIDFDMDYRAEVRLSGVRISNQHEWLVDFTLDVVGGIWHVVNHTP